MQNYLLSSFAGLYLNELILMSVAANVKSQQIEFLYKIRTLSSCWIQCENIYGVCALYIEEIY